jgi:ribosomal protein S8E
MKIKDILSAIATGNFSEEDLRAINSAAVTRLKANRSILNQAAKRTLTLGSVVKVNHPKLAGQTFVLSTINRTKAVVRRHGEMFGGYTVPLSLVESI